MNTANNTSNLITAKATRKARRRSRRANAFSGGINSISNWWNQQQMLNRMFPHHGGTNINGFANTAYQLQRGTFDMPIDVSVYSMIRPPAQPEGPLDQYGKMISIKSLIGGEQLNEMQRTKLGRDMQEEENFKPALRRRDARTRSARRTSCSARWRLAPQRHGAAEEHARSAEDAGRALQDEARNRGQGARAAPRPARERERPAGRRGSGSRRHTTTRRSRRSRARRHARAGARAHPDRPGGLRRVEAEQLGRRREAARAEPAARRPEGDRAAPRGDRGQAGATLAEIEALPRRDDRHAAELERSGLSEPDQLLGRGGAQGRHAAAWGSPAGLVAARSCAR
jgi:hypothetical protein